MSIPRLLYTLHPLIYRRIIGGKKKISELKPWAFKGYTTMDCKQLCRDSPSQTTPETSTKKMVIQGMVACYRLHRAPRMGDIGDTDLMRMSSRLLRVLAFCQADLYVKFATSNKLFFWGALSQRNSTAPSIPGNSKYTRYPVPVVKFEH